MEKSFINNAFTKALDDYQLSNDKVQGIKYNSFLVVVIRMLISLYGELDIINPYSNNDEELLKNNLGKFGYSKENIEIFFSNLALFYEIELANENKIKKEKNPYFIAVQKNLIDILIKKKLNFYLTDIEVREFYDLLYTPYTSNPLRFSYNYLTALDELEVDNYFKHEMSENTKVILSEEKHFLNFKAYEALKYSIEDIKKMTASEIEKVNSRVYSYFGIRENAINKEYLLEKALETLEREENKVTSGNGYVDILLVLSIICTVVMVVGIITFIII